MLKIPTGTGSCSNCDGMNEFWTRRGCEGMGQGVSCEGAPWYLKKSASEAEGWKSSE